MKCDGHIHTPYCPHGSSDGFDEYITKAIELGYNEISFTEHAPLPKGFNDPTPDKDSGMKFSDLDEYIEEVASLKNKYKHKIKINIGLEIDFIVGFEEKTTQFLNHYGTLLDDSILSVHFLKKTDQYYCLDYSAEMFAEMIPIFGAVGTIYESYYDTILQSISADLGIYKPKRIGHISLVHKFQKKFPCSDRFTNELKNIVAAIKEQNLQLDYNGAGAVKPLCQEPYPPDWVVQEALKQKIPLVYGSDAHRAKDLEQGFNQLYTHTKLVSQTRI